MPELRLGCTYGINKVGLTSYFHSYLQYDLRKQVSKRARVPVVSIDRCVL